MPEKQTSRKLTFNQCASRYRSYEEAADHIRKGGWAGENKTYNETEFVAKRIDAQAQYWFNKMIKFSHYERQD